MMAKLMNKIYAWTIGEGIRSDKYFFRKAKILVNVHVIALALIVFSVLLAMTIEPFYAGVFSLVFAGLFVSLLCFRRWQSFNLSGNGFVLISTLATLYMIYHFGGYESTYMVWLFMIPVYSFVIANRVSAIIWFVITLALILVVLFFFPTAVLVDLGPDRLKYVVAINMLAFFGFIFAMEYLSSKERTELLEDLEFEKQQTKAIMAKIPAGLAYIDKELKVQYYNPVLAKFFRIKNSDGVGQHLRDIIGEYYYEYNLPYYLRALEGETVIYERHVGKGEHKIFIRCTYVPRFNQKGEVLGFVNLIADLTKMKEAEQLKLAANEAQKEALIDKLDFRNRELASQELFITNQKKLLEGIKQSLKQLPRTMDANAKKGLNKIIQTIDQNLNLEDEWDNFKMQFERIHPDFINRLQSIYPQLNTRELRHCSYLKMRLSNKEIARIQNLSLKSVEMTNYRLKKKLVLGSKTMLPEFINTF
ncbi:MAG: PAS domain-containing protein [Bacteroidota bacterium]